MFGGRSPPSPLAEGEAATGAKRAESEANGAQSPSNARVWARWPPRRGGDGSKSLATRSTEGAEKREHSCQPTGWRTVGRQAVGRAFQRHHRAGHERGTLPLTLALAVAARPEVSVEAIGATDTGPTPAGPAYDTAMTALSPAVGSDPDGALARRVGCRFAMATSRNTSSFCAPVLPAGSPKRSGLYDEDV